MNSTKYLLVILCVFSLVPVAVGCAQEPKPTWHERYQWKAEDYFEDKEVVKLCRAIEADDVEQIDQLIAAGVNVNAEGKQGMTPLLWAFPGNHSERFIRLLKAGADPNVYVASDFGTKGAIRSGDCVTILAAKSPFMSHFSAVMGHGGDANARNSNTQESVLLAVIRSGKADAKDRIGLLIEHHVDLNNVEGSGKPPVIEAVSWFAQFDVALLMLEHGADHRAYIEEQNSRLIHAVLRENKGLSRLTAERQAQHAKLLKWLKDKGESIEEATADLERWKSWNSLPFPEIKRRREAEMAARKSEESKCSSR